MDTKTPEKITPKIKKLCEMIVPISEINLQFVEVDVDSYALKLECIENVKKKINRDGGSIQYGWAIWEWPHIMVEAEFHAVWVDQQGNLIDITPKEDNQEKILFLKDNSRTYTGNRIDNFRLNISNNPSVIKLIEVSQKLTEAINKDDKEAIFILNIQARELIKEVKNLKIKLGRNDICDCGSGKKFKNCCGKD